MELIIYVAISMSIMVGMVTFVWNIIGTEVKVDISTDLTQNARISLEKITQTVQAAEILNLPSCTFDVHPGQLELAYADIEDYVLFDTYEKTVDIADQQTTIRKLRMTVGFEDPVDLTTDDVDVTNFVITNLSRENDSQNVKIELTLEYINISDFFPWNTTITLETSVSIRER